jgi:hypothetical protein
MDEDIKTLRFLLCLDKKLDTEYEKRELWKVIVILVNFFREKHLKDKNEN